MLLPFSQFLLAKNFGDAVCFLRPTALNPRTVLLPLIHSDRGDKKL
ncbi:hypothetical protein ZORO111902_17320 [Zobellia roscoffensis]